MPTFADIKGSYLELDGLIQQFGNPALERLGPIHLPEPPLESAAFRFYHQISWLYVAIVEVGGVTFRFLVSRARTGGFDQDNGLTGFMRDAHAIRTLFQHNLSPEERSDAAKIAFAGRWFASATGRPEAMNGDFWPTDVAEWEALETALNDQGFSFFRRIIGVVEHIRDDPFNGPILDEWAMRCSRTLPPHVLDQIIIEALPRLGLPLLDAQRVRARHYQEWNDQLRLLEDGGDMRIEAQRLVDQSLLSDWEQYCPVDGDDVINRLGIQPGPRVGEALRLAQRLWRENPCDADELLQVVARTLAIPYEDI